MANIKVVLVLPAIFVLIALALVGAGKGVCVSGRKVAPTWVLANGCHTTYETPINRWGRSSSSIGGQYFVFISSLLLCVATIGAIFVKGKLPVIGLTAAGCLLCMMSFALECYYATAWTTENSSMYYESAYNMSWAAAAAFYIFAAICYGINLCLTLLSKD